MIRLTASMIAMALLCGCSELQVIGRASFNELTADAISVDTERYAARSERQKRQAESRVMVAKVEPRVMEQRNTKPGDQKELWRH